LAAIILKSKHMKPLSLVFLTMLVLGLTFSACKKEPEIVKGCTDPVGDNYNPQAEVSDSSCTYQKRFLGDYTGTLSCQGIFAAVFNTADLSIKELINKSKVNIILQTTIGPLAVEGTVVPKNQLNVDATIPNLSINPKTINSQADSTQVKVDASVKTLLTVSDDNKKITGVLDIKLVTKEPITVSGIMLPAGFPLSDMCGFTGTKK